MTRWLLLLMVALGCSDAGGPDNAALDPTVLITNDTDWPVYFTWRDGRSVFGSDTVAPRSQACEQFLARADSAYWEVYVGDSLSLQPGYAYYRTNWFHPLEREYWTGDVSGPPFSVIMRDAVEPPC